MGTACRCSIHELKRQPPLKNIGTPHCNNVLDCANRAINYVLNSMMGPSSNEVRFGDILAEGIEFNLMIQIINRGPHI